MVTYLDNAATTKIDPEVREIMLHYFDEEYGNAGSRTHIFGSAAKQAVQKARQQIATSLGCEADEVIFTSGATESNNLALLGLSSHAVDAGRKHVISTAIEHKAVLEPLQQLVTLGFEVEFLKPNQRGYVEPEAFADRLRPDTILVSVMQVNNETGVEQPISEICEVFRKHNAYLHVDAAQGFGKVSGPLRNQRIDMASISGHKINGPVGVGALMVRKRDFKRPPIKPLLFGGGQQGGLRPGTLPVPLIAGLGMAAEIWERERSSRTERNQVLRANALRGLVDLSPCIIGDDSRTLPNILNLALPGIDAEAAIVVVKDLAAISNGSACTSTKHSGSHVLKAMGLAEEIVEGAIRISWSHDSDEADWAAIAQRLMQFA